MFLPHLHIKGTFLEGDGWGNDLELPVKGIILAGHFQRSGGAIQQHLAAKLMADDRGIGEETIAPAVVGVVVGVDHIAHGQVQLLFDELSNLKRFLRHERVDDDCPLRAGNRARRNLGVCVALKPINVL
jgi:hypothetical protein